MELEAEWQSCTAARCGLYASRVALPPALYSLSMLYMRLGCSFVYFEASTGLRRFSIPCPARQQPHQSIENKTRHQRPKVKVAMR